jgi:hypothetical protein
MNTVWEFALDEEGDEEQDEATVRPFTVDSTVDPSVGMLIVSATFTLNDGSTRNGYLTPPFHGNASLAVVQPVVVTEQGQVSFWLGMFAPTSEQLAGDYELLQSDADSTFPIHFRSDLPSTHGPISGVIAGFYVLEDFSTGEFRTIK